jgi:hypothetical protein
MGRRAKKGKGRRAKKGKGDESICEEELIVTKTQNGQEDRATCQAKDQYQHYIPRFILRNFAQDDYLIHSRERHEILLYSLADQELRIADVDTSYGVYNMYSDIQNIKDLNFVELELSSLEQEASNIIKRVLDLSVDVVTISYPELVSLRKFLWIMSFRYPGRRRQYTENRFDQRGKRIQEDFMQFRDRSSLDDVWLESIKGILLEDPENPQRISLAHNTGTIGPMENIDYKSHDMTTFLCIWEAEEPFEFVLTDNGFNIFEGDCGRAFAGSAYHYFYPLSPRRIIVAANTSFKSNHDVMGACHREMANAILGVDPKNSWFEQELHIPPKVKYFGKPDGIGFGQDGNF